VLKASHISRPIARAGSSILIDDPVTIVDGREANVGVKDFTLRAIAERV